MTPQSLEAFDSAVAELRPLLAVLTAVNTLVADRSRELRKPWLAWFRSDRTGQAPPDLEYDPRRRLLQAFAQVAADDYAVAVRDTICSLDDDRYNYESRVSHREVLRHWRENQLASDPPTWIPFWSAKRTTLIDSSSNAIVFHEALDIELHFSAERGYQFRVPVLGIVGEGDNHGRAHVAAADAIRSETDALLHTMSHTLSREQLERKGVLLGNVDVVASKISKPLGEHAWVVGRVEKSADGEVMFRDDRTYGESYAIAPDVSVPNDAFLRMAKMGRDDAGDPKGPVIEFGEPLDNDPEGTWAEWQKRMGRA